jgi:hypothetical protein
MTTMNNDDLAWLVAQQPATIESDPAGHDRALAALRSHIAPRPAHRLRPGWTRSGPLWPRVAVGATLSLAAVGAVAGVIASEQPASSRPGVDTHHVAGAVAATGRAAAHQSPLIRLASDVTGSAAPSGNATLVARTTISGGHSVTVYDLYTDSGQYYFSQIESGMAAQVSAGNNQADGLFAREVAAAKLAATGNVTQAAQAMADAPDPSHVVSPETVPTAAQQAAAAAKEAAMSDATQAAQGAPDVSTLFDNYVWEDSQDAIIAGSGDPQVRAGVLRILATLPGVTVTDTTTNGTPTLTLTATAPEMGSDYTEALTINASDGVPVRFNGGPSSDPTAITVNYAVSRVDTVNLGASGSAG